MDLCIPNSTKVFKMNRLKYKNKTNISILQLFIRKNRTADKRTGVLMTFARKNMDYDDDLSFHIFSRYNLDWVVIELKINTKNIKQE